MAHDTKQAQHTPTPWSAKEYTSPKDSYYIEGPEGWFLRIGEMQRANAEFIVHAVNCHEELVAALQWLVTLHENPDSVGSEYYMAWNRAKAAIAKAEARP